ncbi:hypothetical protein [Streptomyces marianii]|uniref:Uncharacterized protein n=1 Tax=Streptomyces marianii TaxID=1817406 RepID=A0A5R9E5R7_9ACTN|nr:hypothetical protein [Streptomyces marianii]TLQ43353.1 hypothetical protein FEF34_09560 [Streptomyces marianii]
MVAVEALLAGLGVGGVPLSQIEVAADRRDRSEDFTDPLGAVFQCLGVGEVAVGQLLGHIALLRLVDQVEVLGFR